MEISSSALRLRMCLDILLVLLSMLEGTNLNGFFKLSCNVFVRMCDNSNPRKHVTCWMDLFLYSLHPITIACVSGKRYAYRISVI